MLIITGVELTQVNTDPGKVMGVNPGSPAAVAGLQTVVDIHIGMVCACLVLDGVLDELESGNADGVERKMISATGVAHGESSHPEIFKGFHPRFEDGSHGFVLLQVDAADFSGAVVDIEIS